MLSHRHRAYSLPRPTPINARFYVSAYLKNGGKAGVAINPGVEKLGGKRQKYRYAHKFFWPRSSRARIPGS